MIKSGKLGSRRGLDRETMDIEDVEPNLLSGQNIVHFEGLG